MRAQPEWEAFDAARKRDCRLVALDGETVAGWAALSTFSSRPVYGGVAEASVYVAAETRGNGLGSRLLAELIAESERCGYWTLLAKIFPENAASLALVRRYGFRQVGVLEMADTGFHVPQESMARFAQLYAPMEDNREKLRVAAATSPPGSSLLERSSPAAAGLSRPRGITCASVRCCSMEASCHGRKPMDRSCAPSMFDSLGVRVPLTT